MKKKGFTLVELIAVLVIMAIIAVISVPIVYNQIESTRLESYKASVRNVLSAVSSYMAKSEGVDNFPNEGLIIPTSEYYKNLSLKNAEFISGRIFLNEEGVLVAKEVSDGTFCASGTKNDLDVIRGACEFIDDTKPEINVMVNRITTTSITVSVNSSDNESGITDYKYYLNGKLIAETKNNIYTFKDLKPNTEYEIKVVTINGNNLEAEQTLNVTTITREILIDAKPEGWSHSKTVTITFSKETVHEVYRYKKVGDINWINVVGNKVDFLIEQNCTIIAQTLSSNGEVIVEVTKAIGSIDNDKPIVIGITGNDEVWKLSKQITIDATDGVGSGIESYSFDGGTTWQDENKKVVTERQTLNVAVKDKLGNISDVKTYEISYIDNTIPKAHSITASTSAGVYSSDTWTNKTVTLTANPNPAETPSGYVYQWYEKSGENFIAIEGATNKTLVLENDIIKSYRVDIRTNAGSEATTSSNDYIVKIDKMPPSCNMQAQYTTWTKGSRTLKLTCVDLGSLCTVDTRQKVWTYNESGKEIKTETLAYTVRDNAGNSKTCTYNNYGIYVDKKSPSISIVSTSVKTNSATIGYNVTDYGSGPTKATCVYGLDTNYGSTGTVNSNNNGCTLANLTNNTKYYYRICASDNIGNEKTCVDGNLTTAVIKQPSIESVKNPSTAQNGYVKQEIAKVKYVSDGIANPRYFVKTTKQGISSLEVIRSCGGNTYPNINGCVDVTGTTLAINTWYEVSGNVDVTYDEKSGNGTIYATTYDGVSFANNKTLELLKIDGTSPTVDIKSSSSTGNSITVNYALSDTESGIGSYTCKFAQASNDGIISAGNASYGSNATSVTSTSCTISGLKDYTDYYYQVCATDNVGNYTTCQTGSAKTKDGTKPSKPTVTLKLGSASGSAYSSGAWTNQNVYHIVTSSDSGSGIAYYQYSHDGKTGWSGDINTLGWRSSYNSDKTQLTYVFWWGMNYNFYIRSVDNAGNVSDVSSMFTVRIDTIAPKCTSSGGSGSWTNGSRTLTGTCSDEGGSGCTGNVSRTINWNINSATQSPGTVYDRAGNSTTCPSDQTVKIDTNPPSCGTASGASTSWTNQNRTVSVGCSDTGGSYCVQSSYSKTTSSTQQQDSVVIRDNAGNTRTCTYNVYVDKISPTCTSSGGSTSWTTGSRTLTGTCSDEGGSGCKGNVSWFINWSGNWTGLSPGTVYDNAGNSASCPANQTVKVDKCDNKTTTIISYGNWSWGACSTTCGTGTQAGTRINVEKTYSTLGSGLCDSTRNVTENGSQSCSADSGCNCGWSLDPVISGGTVTFTFTPTNGCTFSKVERLTTSRTYTPQGGSAKSYPLFQCSTTVVNGVPTPLACGPGDYSPVSSVTTKTSSSTKYVYEFSNYHKGKTVINVKFKATFNNNKTKEINYRISNCSVCDSSTCYTNEAYAGWKNVCK